MNVQQYTYLRFLLLELLLLPVFYLLTRNYSSRLQMVDGVESRESNGFEGEDSSTTTVCS